MAGLRLTLPKTRRHISAGSDGCVSPPHKSGVTATARLWHNLKWPCNFPLHRLVPNPPPHLPTRTTRRVWLGWRCIERSPPPGFLSDRRAKLSTMHPYRGARPRYIVEVSLGWRCGEVRPSFLQKVRRRERSASLQYETPAAVIGGVLRGLVYRQDE